jgi:(p)ppGpp synthase/HD superfamily hydrolase
MGGMPKPKLSRLQEAVKWAAKLHRGQDRDGACPVPYLAHPLEVLGNLRYRGGVTDEDLLCAAVLHDVVEECGVDLADIEKRFGPRVRGLVAEVTRREPTAQESKGMTPEEVWQLRADWMLEDIKRMSPEAKSLKLADRWSNLIASLATREGAKLDRYVQQTFLILEAIPREVNPALWDGVKKVLDEPRG